MSAPDRSERVRLLILLLLAGLLLARLTAMAALPLMDTTEARYGEIGRKMAEIGDGVTPWFDDGVPFWGKPPLSFWLTAASFRLFGVSEFAARLPHLLCTLLAGALVWQLGRQRSPREGLLALSLLAGSLLFFVGAAGVMTDPALVLATTLAMHGFWLALHHNNQTARRRQGWQVFVGLAVGLLAKGPIAAVFVLVPLLLWTVLCGRAMAVWRAIPWVRGGALAALLVVPWYLLAEQRTPGFLRYFLLGEHWRRFVTPGWGGDLYGSAHRHAPGSIWLYALGATLPWLPLLGLLAMGLWRRSKTPGSDDDNADAAAWQRFLLLWALWPLIFFTAARNIVWSYVLPSLPAAALLAAGWIERRTAPGRPDAWVAGGLAVTLLTSIAVLTVGLRTGRFDRATARPVVRAYELQRAPGEPLVFMGHRPSSAAFYGQGQVGQVDNAQALAHRLGHGSGFVAVPAAAGKESLRLVFADGDVLRVGQFGAYELLHVWPDGAPEAKPPGNARLRLPAGKGAAP